MTTRLASLKQSLSLAKPAAMLAELRAFSRRQWLTAAVIEQR